MSASALWSVAVAVKPLREAKSRLGLFLSLSERQGLALAMAEDVVRAILDCTEVGRCVLVTADEVAAARLGSLGAEVIGEPGPRGLDAAYRRARDYVGDAPLALVMADLPCLDPAALSTCLAAVPDIGVAVVADLDGSGTTVLAARRASLLRPSYGPGSRARHRAGAVLDLSEQVDVGLRQDLDTWESLQRIWATGTAGPATSNWVHWFALRGGA